MKLSQPWSLGVTNISEPREADSTGESQSVRLSFREIVIFHKLLAATDIDPRRTRTDHSPWATVTVTIQATGREHSRDTSGFPGARKLVNPAVPPFSMHIMFRASLCSFISAVKPTKLP